MKGISCMLSLRKILNHGRLDHNESNKRENQIERGVPWENLIIVKYHHQQVEIPKIV